MTGSERTLLTWCFTLLYQSIMSSDTDGDYFLTSLIYCKCNIANIRMNYKCWRTFPSVEKLSWNKNDRQLTRSSPRLCIVSRYSSRKYHTCDAVSINRNWNPSGVIVGSVSPSSLQHPGGQKEKEQSMNHFTNTVKRVNMSSKYQYQNTQHKNTSFFQNLM